MGVVRAGPCAARPCLIMGVGGQWTGIAKGCQGIKGWCGPWKTLGDRWISPSGAVGLAG
jgi:hypothetical protein